jgi:hypothetical protein
MFTQESCYFKIREMKYRSNSINKLKFSYSSSMHIQEPTLKQSVEIFYVIFLHNTRCEH